MLRYPTFSEAEMSHRREAVAAVLREAEAEAEHLVVYGANRAGSGVQSLTPWPVDARSRRCPHTRRSRRAPGELLQPRPQRPTDSR